MANTLYANTETTRVATGGGTLAVNAGASPLPLSANTIPCRLVRLSIASGNIVHFAVGSVNVSNGAILPSIGSTLIGVDDAAKIYVFASSETPVYATYMY